MKVARIVIKRTPSLPVCVWSRISGILVLVYNLREVIPSLDSSSRGLTPGRRCLWILSYQQPLYNVGGTMLQILALSWWIRCYPCCQGIPLHRQDWQVNNLLHGMACGATGKSTLSYLGHRCVQAGGDGGDDVQVQVAQKDKSHTESPTRCSLTYSWLVSAPGASLVRKFYFTLTWNPCSFNFLPIGLNSTLWNYLWCFFMFPLHFLGCGRLFAKWP